MKTTEERIIELVREGLTTYGDYPDEITSASTFEADLGCDSLDLVELIMAAEEEFDLTISGDEVENLKTVGDAVALVDRLVDEQHPTPEATKA